MTTPLYHFTDTARLPSILSSGELRPGRNAVGNFPDPDFVWATTSDQGDRTSSGAHSREAYRLGQIRMVRITLAPEDFVPWREIVSRYPSWTPDHVARLERSANGKSSPADWWCRADPLARGRWRGIETRSWSVNRWVPLPTDLHPNCIGLPTGDRVMSLVIGDVLYASAQVVMPSGALGYRVVMR